MELNKNIIKKKIVNVFVCLRCMEMKMQRHEPPSHGCKTGRYHIWRNLGVAGSDRYRCKKCGITVSVQSQPPVVGCTVQNRNEWENENRHEWEKLI
jgi:transposase-like protein